MKLLDFVRENEHLLNKDNVFVILDDKNKSIMHYALYKKDDIEKAVYLYVNIFTSIKLTKIEDDDLPLYYKMMEINEDNIITLSRKEYIQFHKKSIKETVKNNKTENYYKLISFMRKNAGSLCSTMHKVAMFIGIAATDEDYYYVSVYNDNGNIKFSFDSCCGDIYLIDKKDYTKKEYDLIKFVKDNKYKIIEQIDSFDNDVIINGVNFGNKNSFKKYKDNSLSIILNLYRNYLGKDNKCIKILEDKLIELNDDILNAYVIKLLNKIIQEYYHYYKPLPIELKNYYYENFYNKVKNKLRYSSKKIYNKEIRNYVLNICKALNKEFKKIK